LFVLNQTEQLGNIRSDGGIGSDGKELLDQWQLGQNDGSNREKSM